MYSGRTSPAGQAHPVQVRLIPCRIGSFPAGQVPPSQVRLISCMLDSSTACRACSLQAKLIPYKPGSSPAGQVIPLQARVIPMQVRAMGDSLHVKLIHYTLQVRPISCRSGSSSASQCHSLQVRFFSWSSCTSSYAQAPSPLGPLQVRLICRPSSSPAGQVIPCSSDTSLGGQTHPLEVRHIPCRSDTSHAGQAYPLQVVLIRCR